MKRKEIYSGIHAVLYAMFDQNEALSREAMELQVEYCVSSNCHGITVLGLATEVLKLTLNERKALVKTVGMAINQRVPFSVTVAGNSVAEQLELAHCAEECGADWLILQPPMVGNYSAEIYLQFFERVINGVNLSVAIQNAPQYLGRALSSNDIAVLRERCSNFVAI